LTRLVKPSNRQLCFDVWPVDATGGSPASRI
jgi:hypothetical protein